MNIEATLHAIRPLAEAIAEAGGSALLVGGAVRDLHLGRTPADLDLEVYRLESERVAAALGRVGRVERIGRSFSILRLWRRDAPVVDVALPQRRRLADDGQLVAEADPAMTPEESLARRDFSWNAMALTPDGALLDPYGGLADIAARVIRHVGPLFADDPLRVLRAVQFAARFDMALAPETAALCAELLPRAAELPPERVWGEWQKWALLGERPSAGLAALRASGWLAHYPELAALVGCPQRAIWHPEGDVWVHTGLVCDMAAHIAAREHLDERGRVALVFAALCHDLGKPLTTVVDPNGEHRSPGHAAAGIAPSMALLRQIAAPEWLADRVAPLVREHMVHIRLEPNPRNVRRLAVRLAPATVVAWSWLVESDHSGRPPLPPGNPALPIVTLAALVGAADGKPAPLVLGRHLLAHGWGEGPELGAALRQIYQAQIDGAFDDEEQGVAWAIAHCAKPS